MATARITCPDCKSVLRPAKPVPDGKKVKCPKCGNQFTTPGLVEEEEERPRAKAAVKKAPKKKEKAVKQASAPQAPAKKADFDDEEEGGGIYSFVGADETKEEDEEEENKPQIEYAPDMSIKDLRGPAQAEVIKPSNLMVLIGGLSALSNIFLICWSFWPMIFSESVVDWQTSLSKYYKAKQDKDSIQRVEGYKDFKDLKEKDLVILNEANKKAIWEPKNDEFPYMGRLWLMGIFILVLIYNGIAIMGAVKMQNLESRRWGIASSIMMLLPPGSAGIGCLFTVGIFFLEEMTGLLGEVTQFYAIGLFVICYLASIYVAVMSLRALMDQKVIDGYEYIAD